MLIRYFVSISCYMLMNGMRVIKCNIDSDGACFQFKRNQQNLHKTPLPTVYTARYYT